MQFCYGLSVHLSACSVVLSLYTMHTVHSFLSRKKYVSCVYVKNSVLVKLVTQKSFYENKRRKHRKVTRKNYLKKTR